MKDKKPVRRLRTSLEITGTLSFPVTRLRDEFIPLVKPPEYMAADRRDLFALAVALDGATVTMSAEKRDALPYWAVLELPDTCLSASSTPPREFLNLDDVEAGG